MGPQLSLEELVTGLVIIWVWIAPICPASVDAINLQTQNSSDLSPKLQGLPLVYPQRNRHKSLS